MKNVINILQRIKIGKPLEEWPTEDLPTDK
jgi:hypothetical protein